MNGIKKVKESDVSLSEGVGESFGLDGSLAQKIPFDIAVDIAESKLTSIKYRIIIDLSLIHI